MDIQNLVPVDYSNRRVLTTAQVAEALDCSIEQLRSNFKNHKDQFEEGVHYFKVEGGALYALKRAVKKLCSSSTPSEKGVNQIHAVSFGKGAKCLNLWTKQGVARHSKLIDTPQAWELFNALEKHYFNSVPAAPVETSLFPDEEPVKKVRRRPTPELAVVYAVLLSNMLVKIGMTRDLTARMKDLQKETKADVLAWAASAVMTRDEAILLERALKVKFFAHLVSGEFFNCNFDDVKAALVAPDDKFTKLLALAREMEPSPEKNQLLLQAAAVLA